MDETFWAALALASTDDSVLNYYVSWQIQRPLLHLVHKPDGSGFYYGGGTPLILGYLVPAFLLGIFYVLWRRPAAFALLFAWIGLTVLGNSFLRWNDWTPRFAVLFPALCLLMAVGLRYTLPLILPERSLDRRLVTALALALAIPQLVYYAGPHLEMYNQQIREYRDHQDVLYRSRQFPAGTHVHIITRQLVFMPHVETLTRFWNLNVGVEVQTPEEFMAEGLPNLSLGANHAFFFEPDNLTIPALLEQRLNLEPPPQWSLFNVPRDKQYLLYYLPGQWHPSQ
jgi:hypothetical protein